MTEILWHGRGGQGAKTASQLLADAAFLHDGSHDVEQEYPCERVGRKDIEAVAEAREE